MSFGNVGWDNSSVEDSPSMNTTEYGPRRFWMPAQATKRILFLDAEPFCFYEHSLWALTGNGKDKEICLKKNNIDDRGCSSSNKSLWL